MPAFQITEILKRYGINFVQEEIRFNGIEQQVCRVFLRDGICSFVLSSLNTPDEQVLWNRLREFQLV